MSYLSGYVDANHWSYVASAMAEAIKRYTSEGKFSAQMQVPPAVLYAAGDFFETVIEAFGGGQAPSNPLETACNYSIAASAIRQYKDTPPARAELNKTLHAYHDLVRKLIDRKPLESGERSLLIQLGHFFDGISDAGEMEAYDDYVAMGYHSRRH